MAATKNTAKKTTKANPAMDWLLAFMTKNPKAVYADAATASKRTRHAIYPIMWGRAQVILGRVKQKPRGQGKAAMAKKTGTTSTPTGKRRGRPPGSKNKPKDPAALGVTAAKRGPGRPRKNPTAGLSIPIASDDLGTMQQLVDALNGGGSAALRYDSGSWSLAVN